MNTSIGSDSTAENQGRSRLGTARRWVIKLGSALLTADGRGLSPELLRPWVEQMVAMREAGHEIVVVSSGAIAEGMRRFGWKSRPHVLHELQAAAALGQMGLAQYWESAFQEYGLRTAQILLTHDDLSDRQRYLNARSTLQTLVKLGVIPVINENDTVVTEEICFGDNDTLAALVANLLEADALVLLTDQEGLYTANPRKVPDAQLVGIAKASDPTLDGMASGEQGALGRGGMATKLRAARLAARSGTMTVIASGLRQGVLPQIMDGREVGTLLIADSGRWLARKQWLGGQLRTRGRLTLDDGAVRALSRGGRSLLPVGVLAVEGHFRRGEMVTCLSRSGEEVSRGLVNYAANEIRKIKGSSSDQIERELGYVNEPELIHRDNMVLMQERVPHSE